MAQRSHPARSKRSGGDSGDGDQQGDGESEGGETDENVNLQVSGKSPKGGFKSKALSPEELKKFLEQGAQIDPSQSNGAADGEGMYLPQLSGKSRRPSWSRCASSSARSDRCRGTDASS